MESHGNRDDQGAKPVSAAASTGRAASVLFVDLDGTLIRTDLLREASLRLLRQSPGQFLRALFALRRGRAALKRAISQKVTHDAERLPYRKEVLEFIAKQRSLGQRIVLATASDSVWAEGVAQKLGLFDDILASDGTHNLKGKAKLDAIRTYCREHGAAEFDYLGDSRADLPIWREAQAVYMAAPSARLVRQVRRFAEPAAILDARGAAEGRNKVQGSMAKEAGHARNNAER